MTSYGDCIARLRRFVELGVEDEGGRLVRPHPLVVHRVYEFLGCLHCGGFVPPHMELGLNGEVCLDWRGVHVRSYLSAWDWGKGWMTGCVLGDGGGECSVRRWLLGSRELFSGCRGWLDGLVGLLGEVSSPLSLSWVCDLGVVLHLGGFALPEVRSSGGGLLLVWR